MSAGLVEEIRLRVQSRETLIVAVTHEEARLVRIVREATKDRGYVTWEWDLQRGLVAHTTPAVVQRADDPIAALHALRTRIERDRDQSEVFVLKDLHHYWTNPAVIRAVRNVAQDFKYVRKTVIVCSPHGDVPPDLREDAAVVVVRPPAASELETVLELLGRGEKPGDGPRVSLSKEGRREAVRAASGLSLEAARVAFSRVIVNRGCFRDEHVPDVLIAKKALISQSAALEFIESDVEEGDVGGLAGLKAWLEQRRGHFSEEARAFGIEPPRGIVLAGVPGTGKSLTAKMVARRFGLPLVKFDLAAVYGSLLGQSEERLRRTLQCLDAIGPAVVWCDELEKAMGGGDGDLDGGTSKRVLGQVLSWMQERRTESFVVATCNDLFKLPPESVRKGRFDEVFFLDLPSAADRRAILGIHLRRRRRDPASFDLELAARATRGFVGAELEQVVKDALTTAFHEGRRDLRTADLLAAAAASSPMSLTQSDRIDAIRSYASAHALRPAAGAAGDPASEGTFDADQPIALHTTAAARNGTRP